MGLETPVDYLDDLDSANPLPGDVISQADDHMRNIKKALKQTFPGSGGVGFDKPITSSEDELNILDGVTSDSDDLNLLSGLSAAGTKTLLDLIYPVGAIYISTANTPPDILLGGTWTAVQTGRVLLSEDGGTTYTAGDTGGSKDAINVAHTHGPGTLGTNTTGSHQHTDTGYHTLAPGNNPFNTSGVSSPQTITNNAAGNHSHSVNSGATASAGSSGTDANLPPYLAVFMWERTA